MVNYRTCSVMIVVAIAATALCGTEGLFAQDPGGAEGLSSFRSSFGVTRNEATVFVADGATGSISSRGVGVAGFQYTYSHRPDRRLDLLTDLEFELGALDRGPTITYVFGGQAVAGPRLNVWKTPFSVHVLGGLSALRLTGDTVYSGGSSSPTIYYVGGDPIFRDFLNNYRSSSSSSARVFPGSTRTTPVAIVGLSVPLNRARLSGEFLRIDKDRTQLGVVRAGVGFRF